MCSQNGYSPQTLAALFSLHLFSHAGMVLYTCPCQRWSAIWRVPWERPKRWNAALHKFDCVHRICPVDPLLLPALLVQVSTALAVLCIKKAWMVWAGWGPGQLSAVQLPPACHAGWVCQSSSLYLLTTWPAL